MTLTALAITAAVVTAGGQLYAGAAAKSQANFEAKVANQNAKMEGAAIADAQSRRQIDQMRLWRRVSQQLGDSRAKNAAGGLDVNFGSPAEAQTDITQIGAEDSSVLNKNYDKEVMGYDINAANYTNQARAAKARGSAAMTGAIIGATGTLLSAASQIGGKLAASSGASASFGPG
ncbi:MAG: hypothetical protein ACJ8FS_16335 [Sphingomicrobium sp.]